MRTAFSPPPADRLPPRDKRQGRSVVGDKVILVDEETQVILDVIDLVLD